MGKDCFVSSPLARPLSPFWWFIIYSCLSFLMPTPYLPAHMSQMLFSSTELKLPFRTNPSWLCWKGFLRPKRPFSGKHSGKWTKQLFPLPTCGHLNFRLWHLSWFCCQQLLRTSVSKLSDGMLWRGWGGRALALFLLNGERKMQIYFQKSQEEKLIDLNT